MGFHTIRLTGDGYTPVITGEGFLNPAAVERGKERRAAIRALLRAGKSRKDICQNLGISYQQYHQHQLKIQLEDALKKAEQAERKSA